MKTREILVICFLFLATVSFTYWYQSNRAIENSGPRVCFGENCFSVEIADNDAERTTGLMNRESLDSNSGMLFVFDSEQVYPFWMKNTLIPLDMLWLDKDKKVVFVFENALPCEKDPCPVITPDSVAKYVVELNAGVVKEKNIKVGETADFKY